MLPVDIEIQHKDTLRVNRGGEAVIIRSHLRSPLQAGKHNAANDEFLQEQEHQQCRECGKA